MLRPLSPIIIFCEGKTEIAYVQSLARLLRENGEPVQLIPKDLGGGKATNIRKKISEYRKNNKKLEGCLLLRDKDIVLWDTKEDIIDAQLGVRILYSWQNFEDFLVLHMSSNIVQEWGALCTQVGHFKEPLHSEEYLDFFRNNICHNYKKGDLPFELTVDVLCIMYANSKAGFPIHSDFATWIEENWSESKLKQIDKLPSCE